MIETRKQSSTAHPIDILMVLSSDHLTGATGKTVSVTLSKDGGAFAAASGAVTEVGNGHYSLAGHATDRGTLGELVIRATASGCDDTDIKILIVPWDVFDANLGLTNLDTNVGSRSTYAGGAVASVTAAVTVGGYASNQGPDYLVWNAAASSYTGSGSMGLYQGNINTAAGKLTFDGSNYILSHLKVYDSGQDPASSVWGAAATYNTPATMGYVLRFPTVAGYASGQAPDYMVWNAALASYTATGSAGAKLGGLAAAADPWGIDVRTAYTSTQAGYFLNAINTAAGKLTFDGSNAVRSHVYVYESGMSPEELVWPASASTYNASGTMGGLLNAASPGGGGAADPWATALPGSYPSGQAGYILNSIGNAAAKLQFDASNNVYSIPMAYGSGMTPEGRVWGASNGSPTSGTMGYSVVNPIVAGYASGQGPAPLVWNALLASYNATGSFGARVNSLGGDPWTASLGGYSAGQAGYVFNQMAGRVDAPISGIPASLMAVTISGGITFYTACRYMLGNAMGHVQRVGTSNQFNVFEAGAALTDTPIAVGTLSDDYTERTIDELNL